MAIIWTKSSVDVWQVVIRCPKLWNTLNMMRDKFVDESAIVDLEESKRQREILQEELLKSQHALAERIKELNCLYEISYLVEKKDSSLIDILQGVVDLLPAAMQYPENSCARIVMDSREFRTGIFKKIRISFSKNIMVFKKAVGLLEVCYMRGLPVLNKNSFSTAEKKLICSIAERLGRIIERKKGEAALRDSEEKYSAVVENAQAGIFIIQNYVFDFANRSMEKISGYALDELIGMSFLDVFVPEARDFIKRRYEDRLSGKPIPPVYETELLSKNGEIKDVEVSFIVIPYKGEPSDMGFIRDITERKKAEKIIKQLAYHDSLTGVANRVLFSEQFIIAKAHAERTNQKLAVVLLDMDNFKEVNDSFGHQTGDELLKMAADRLNSLLRKEDVVARLGGDEFMLLLQEVNYLQDAEDTAQKIVEAFQVPFVFDGCEIMLTASVGLAIFPDDGEDMNILLKNADIAMYQSKKEGRNTYNLYQKI